MRDKSQPDRVDALIAVIARRFRRTCQTTWFRPRWRHSLHPTDRPAARGQGVSTMYGQLNQLVGREQASDMHRAAERSHLAAGARSMPRARAPRERSPWLTFSWLTPRRRPKVTKVPKIAKVA